MCSRRPPDYCQRRECDAKPRRRSLELRFGPFTWPGKLIRPSRESAFCCCNNPLATTSSQPATPRSTLHYYKTTRRRHSHSNFSARSHWHRNLLIFKVGNLLFILPVAADCCRWRIMCCKKAKVIIQACRRGMLKWRKVCSRGLYMRGRLLCKQRAPGF